MRAAIDCIRRPLRAAQTSSRSYQLTLPVAARCRLRQELRDYARPASPPGRPIVEALADLTARIHATSSSTRATTVHTPLAECCELRRGVCQDFAHLASAALRSMGLPARYMSGYLRTTPPPGKPRLVGADASHAWAQLLVRPARLGRLRSHEQLPGERQPRHDRLGPRLRRRLPDPGRLRRRRRAPHGRQRRRDSR